GSRARTFSFHLMNDSRESKNRVMDETSEKFIGGKIVRGENPLNLEMPFEKLEGFITPTELFYVRTHFPVPNIDRDAWWLRVEGDVENPFAINYEQLLELESMTVPVTLECAGNNRSFLEPKVKGVQWHLGAVGTAEWTGVSLSVLLDRAKPKPQASEVVLEGADGGILEDPKGPPGKLHFARSIPLEKARADVLLAYKMNGSDLPSEHGFPVRAIVPVYGAAWTSDGEITKVELSTEGGATWTDANLLGESKSNAWRLWEFNWQTPAAPEKQTLIARATDSLGRTQPVLRDPDRGTYMISHLLPIDVEVR